MRTLPRPPVALQDAAVDLRSVTRLFGAAPALVRVDLSIERGGGRPAGTEQAGMHAASDRRDGALADLRWRIGARFDLAADAKSVGVRSPHPPNAPVRKLSARENLELFLNLGISRVRVGGARTLALDDVADNA
jgi:hypothetical protein